MNSENIYYSPNNVYFKCNIRKIDKINSVKEDFWCDFSITKYWAPSTIPMEYINNTTLINNKSCQELNEPKIYIKNLIKFSKLNVNYDLITIDSVNYIEKTINYFAKLKANFNFTKFPKDIQNLSIIIQACDDSNSIRLLQSQKYKSLISAINTFQHSHEWRLYHKLTSKEIITNNAYAK